MSSRLVIGTTAATIATLTSYILYNNNKTNTSLPARVRNKDNPIYITFEKLQDLNSSSNTNYNKKLVKYHLPPYSEHWSSKLKQGIQDDLSALKTTFWNPSSQHMETEQERQIRDDLQNKKKYALSQYNDAVKAFNEFIDNSKYNNKEWLYNSVKNQVIDAKEALDQAIYNMNHQENNSSILRPKKVNVDAVANQGVFGWGDTAQEFAREELEQNGNPTPSTTSANETLNKFTKKAKDKGWFTSNDNKVEKPDLEDEKLMAEGALKGLEGWGENAAQFAKDEYEDIKWQFSNSTEKLNGKIDEATQKLNEAQRKVNETKQKWWEFGEKKNDELYKEAQRQYENAKVELDNANKSLQDWNDKISGKFWEKTDKSIDSLKKGSNEVNESVQRNMNKAQDYVQDKK
ncbi:Om45p NDAI_0B03910 [Naumovozyma dairenensis CBS 421]|uniref:Mitochondrial outer membrane protein OM45 n=1 Tax=Naumovozyma dairenensis (strain ATCC 10597 / BCRC 20456 / CBS 421 / NBRC 0211 / NRRL Y-12639) TaxID=1071378 RepID=G0W6L4_NAUDC|nr:hypothetical protein NDAI_0B03910 [Naumovozyma dairenensis CBS 421]CCD23425.1 hypothetical protein NDAI_0B03910 [Naumovozyma dairenensis CBS 421]